MCDLHTYGTKYWNLKKINIDFWPFSVILGNIYDILGKYRARSLKRAQPLTSKIIYMISIHIHKKYRICTQKAHYFFQKFRMTCEKSWFLRFWQDFTLKSSNFIEIQKKWWFWCTWHCILYCNTITAAAAAGGYYTTKNGTVAGVDEIHNSLVVDAPAVPPPCLHALFDPVTLSAGSACLPNPSPYRPLWELNIPLSKFCSKTGGPSR